MKEPKPHYYNIVYHRMIDRIMREKEQRIRRQYKSEPKMDMGEEDADFIPKGNNER